MSSTEPSSEGGVFPPSPPPGVTPGGWPLPPQAFRPPKPHPGFWWAVLWCLGFLVMTQALPGIGILVLAMLFEVVSAPSPGTGLQHLGSPGGAAELARKVLLPSVLVSQLCVIGFSLLALRLVAGRGWARQVALRRPGAWHVALAVLAFPALAVVANGAYAVARQYLPSFSDLLGFKVPGMEEMVREIGTWPVALAVLVIGAGPGVGEELWCRAFLGRGLVGRYGVALGVLLTSFFFGLIHGDPRQGAMAALMGVALHYAYLTARSLWVPVLLHFLNNSLSVVAAHYASGLDVIDQRPEEIPNYLFAAAALLAAAVGWALYRSRRAWRRPTVAAPRLGSRPSPG